MNRLPAYKYHLAALATVIIWGTTFVSTKVLITNSLTPAEIFFVRFLIAYLCIWPLARGRWWAGSLRDELTLAAAGITGGSMYFLTENIALQYAPASNVSLIVCTAPIWTALASALLHRSERMTWRQAAGSAIAFAGVALVVLNGRFVLDLSPRGDMLALAAALLWMGYSLIVKRLSDAYSSLFITRKIFFYGLLTILPVFLFSHPHFDPAVYARPAVWGNLLFLGVVASMICYVAWNAVMHRLGVVRATNYIYLNPLATMITASMVIDERITPAALAGAAMVLYGTWRAGAKK